MAKKKKVKDRLSELRDQYPDLMLMDGYDDCVLGVCYRFGQDPIVAYDQTKVIKKLMKDGMTHEEAVEFFDFNQIGAWVGDLTPCYIELRRNI